MIWFLGVIIVLVYLVFNAGKNTKSLFYNRNSVNADKVILYTIRGLASAFLWPIVLPGVGIYLLGKKFAK